MHVRNLFSLLCVALVGCAGSHAPTGWLPSSGWEAEKTAHGAWIELDHLHDGTHGHVSGELIAIGPVSIFILGDTLAVIPLMDVTHARLSRFASHSTELSLWTVGGSVSTLSHGIGLVISLPVWLISGISSTALQSRVPLEAFPDETWQTLSMYARFPQGMPSALDANTLRAKRLPRPTDRDFSAGRSP